MQAPAQGPGSCNPHDISLHKQIKDIADLLRPELLRLHKCCEEKSGNIQLYISFIGEIQNVKKEITNYDALFTLQNLVNHMQQAIDLVKKEASNQEILWHLQEVMALLFKLQNLPS